MIFEDIGPCKVLIWFATNRCNIRCIHCCAGSTGGPKENELSTTEAKRLIKMTADLGIQYFGIVGGEPLMREDLLELIEEVNLFGMRSHLVTKGTLLTQAWASELAKRDALVSVALDAFSPATYDYICGVPGTYEKARKAIETCAKEGIIQGITATLMKDTTNDVFDLLDFSVQMDFERCPVFVLRPVGRGLDVYWEHAVLGAEYERYLHKLFHRIDEATKAKPMDFFVYDPIYFRVLYQHKATETLRRYYPSGKLCGLGRYLDVDAEGNVLACLFTELKVGNIRERTLKEIWEEVTSSSFFSEIHDPANLKGACCSCKYNDICGGCRTRAYKLTGDWFGADPACAYTKKG